MLIFKHRRHIFRNEANENGEPGGAELPVSQNPRLVGRAAAMEQISAQVEALHAPDLADVDFEAGTTTPREVPPAPEAEPEPDDSVILQAEPEPEAEPEPPKPRMVPIVVDGQTLEVEEQRIIEAGKRTLQKESAADRRLQEANEILNRARAYEQRASQDPALQPNQAPSQDAPQTQPQQEAINGLNDPRTLIPVIENLRESITAEVKESIKSENAVNTFMREFPDIASDPNLWQIAVSLENRRLQEAAALREPPGDALEAYRQHGKEIQAWKAKFAPAPASATAAVAPDKQERKRSITAVPAVNATAPATKPPKVLTTQEEIARIAAERKSYGRPIQTRSNSR